MTTAKAATATVGDSDMLVATVAYQRLYHAGARAG